MKPQSGQAALPRIDVFVSYRRKTSATLAQLIARELEARGIKHVFVDTRATDGAGPFPTRLERAIEACKVFICLMGDGTFDSEWVRHDVDYAHSLGKPMIPVFQGSYIPITDPPTPGIAALLQDDGIHIFDIKNVYVDSAMDGLADMIKRTRTARTRGASRGLLVGLVALIVIAILAAGAIRSGMFNPPPSSPTTTSIVSPTVGAAILPTTAIPTLTLTPTPTTRPTNSPTTAVVSTTAVVASNSPAIVQTTAIAQKTMGAVETQILSTAYPAGSQTVSAVYSQATQTAGALQTLIFLNATASARPPATATLVTTASGGESGKIAFDTNRDGNYEIYVLNADGSDLINLTNDRLADDVEPAWSPDGKHISFSSKRDGNHEIYVMNADGSNQVNLTNNSADDVSSAWSPDGKRIAFSSHRDFNSEIYVMNADGSNPTNLTNNAADDESPAWSPDGKYIAFNSTRDGNEEIYVMNADGSNPNRLTNDPAHDVEPAWSSDGKHIAFYSYRDGNWEIYVMNVDGSNPIRLTSSKTDDIDPAWSP